MPSVPPKRGRARAALPQLALLGAALFALPLGARAATYTVSSLGDDASDPTTLRGAITASEASTDASDTINITATGTIALAQSHGSLFVNNGRNVAGKTLAIVGPGASRLAVDGGGRVGVFYFGNVGSGDIAVSVSGLSIQNGADSNGGAGIFDTQTLSLTDVVLNGNTASGQIGGGLYTFNANVTMTRCTVSNNAATGSYGGGLYVNGGTATLTDCTVSGNTANGAGGVYNYLATLTMTGCTVSGNTAAVNSGGIENDGTATLTGCTISDNSGNYGAGIYNSVNLTLAGCTVTGNSAPDWGGGLFNQPRAGGDILAVTDTVFRANTASVGAGAFSYMDNNTDGGVLSASFTRCTFSGNSASQEGGGACSLDYDESSNGGVLSTAFTNCTFSGNSAGGDFGGGLYVQSTDQTNNGTSALDTALTNCTVSGNTAPSGGGGIDFNGITYNGGGPSCTVTSSLIAGNTLTSSGSDPDYNLDGGFPFTSGGSNLIGVGTAPAGFVAGANHDQVGTTAAPLDAHLGALADNGGPVQTLALLPGSPALDADYNAAVTTDGRGLPRPVGARSDIGAFERQAPTAVADAYSTTVGAAKTVAAPGVLANDSVSAVSNPTAVLATGPAHGALTLNADGSFTYTPDAGFAGADTFTYAVSDGANTSAPATVTLTVQDVTAPVTTAALNPAAPDGGGFYRHPVTVTLTATDDASGVAHTFYTVNGGAPQTYGDPFSLSSDGVYTVAYYSVDAAGNTEAAQSVSFKIDATAPVTTATTQSATTGERVTLSAADGGSGVAGTVYSVDGGAQTPYGGAFTVTGNGPHAVTYHSTDKAGNAETTKTASFTISIAAPVTTASVAGPQGASGDYTGPVTVTLTARSKASTVTGTFYRLDGGAQTPYTAPFVVSGDAAHTVTFHSTDAAGNTEADNTLSVTVRSTPSAPSVAHTFPAGLQLFSVPADYSAVPLGTALSQSNPRLAVWDPAALQYGFAASLQPGQGYWARFTQATSLYDLGTPTPTAQPFTIPLKKGWNMIGDPFPGAVSLGGVTVQSGGHSYDGVAAAAKAGAVAFTLYSYPAGATAYQTQGGDGTLTPYVGYWLYAFQDGALQVPAP